MNSNTAIALTLIAFCGGASLLVWSCAWEKVEVTRALYHCDQAEAPAPAECKPTQAACERALADACRAEADGGVWEAIPYCDRLDAPPTGGELPTDAEMRRAVEDWKRKAPQL